MEQIYDEAKNLIGITKIPQILIPQNWESGTGKELRIIHINDNTVILKVQKKAKKSQDKDKQEGRLARFNLLRFFR